MVNIADRSATPAPVEVRGVSKRFGSAAVLTDVSLSVAAGSMLALLGPSGCGKTTLLRIIAGLEHPDSGEVEIGGEVLTAPGRSLPPERRRVGMVFQDWALFPHLTVARNVGYGLTSSERSGGRVEQALAMVGLSGMGDRLPGTLSGGQQQRVALARAVAPEPRVLLLDEPFSNLDTSLRVQVRSEVHHLLLELGITTVFVTHDQDEAFVLGDEVAVMNEGMIVQQGTPAELYTAPASPWIATFVGEGNLLDGQASGYRAETAVGEVALRWPASGAVQVLLRPEELTLSAADGSPSGAGEIDGSPTAGGRGGERAVVDLVEYYGHDTLYVVQLPGGSPLRVRLASAPRFRRGDVVEVAFAGERTVAYPVGGSAG